jgi:hypothetical protein
VLHANHANFLDKLEWLLVPNENIHYFVILHVLLRLHLEFIEASVEITDRLTVSELTALEYFGP